MIKTSLKMLLNSPKHHPEPPSKVFGENLEIVNNDTNEKHYRYTCMYMIYMYMTCCVHTLFEGGRGTFLGI